MISGEASEGVGCDGVPKSDVAVEGEDMVANKSSERRDTRSGDSDGASGRGSVKSPGKSDVGSEAADPRT